MSDGPKEPEDVPEVTPGTDADATDSAVENQLPADPRQLEPEVVDVRHGMFGVRGTGDTAGYGGLVRAGRDARRHAARPYGGWFDEVADALEARPRPTGADRGAIEKVVVDRGEITFYVRRERPASTWRSCCATTRALRFEFCSRRQRRALPRRRPAASCTRSTTCSR